MSGQNAIVTGGLRGLGRAMALGIARGGWNVLAVGHLPEDVAELERLAAGLPVATLCADLRQAAACDRVVSAARARFGAIDALVNNAGLTFTYIDPGRFVDGPRKFYELTDTIIQDVMDTNFVAAERSRAGSRRR